MFQAKLIGKGLATTGLIGAGVVFVDLTKKIYKDFSVRNFSISPKLHTNINDEVKKDINEKVEDYYENKAPKFVEPSKTEYSAFYKASANFTEEERKQSSWIKANFELGTEKAMESMEKCKDFVVKEVMDNNKNLPKSEVEYEVQQQVNNKYTDNEMGTYMLPGQEEWSQRVLAECGDALSDAESLEKADSGFESERHSYTTEDFLREENDQEDNSNLESNPSENITNPVTSLNLESDSSENTTNPMASLNPEGNSNNKRIHSEENLEEESPKRFKQNTKDLDLESTEPTPLMELDGDV